MSDKTTIDQVPKESHGSQQPGISGTLTSFQGWTVLRQFPAKGGEADVYLVEKDSEKRVLKMYRYGIAPAKEVFERLSRITAQHADHLVPLFSFGEDPASHCFYEMAEFMPEGTLAEHLENGKLPEPAIEQLIHKIAKALSILHSEGILHLDLKPANILLRTVEPLDMVLSDFGISSIFDNSVSKKLTQVKGTSLYQSPESITGVVAPTSDWWSLGIIVLELLQGQHPFEGLQRQVILYQLTTKGIEIPDTLSPRWQNLLMGLLTRNPQKRWGKQEVDRWLSGESVPTHYHSEQAGTTTVGSPNSATATEFRYLTVPTTMGGSTFHTLEDLFLAAFSSPAQWDDTKALMASGAIATWLNANQDTKRIGDLQKLAEAEIDPDQFLFKAGVFFRADMPLVWRGTPLDENRLQGFLAETAQHLSPPETLKLIEALFSGDLFQDYVRFTGKSLGKLDSFIRLAQGLRETELSNLDLPQRANIILLAFNGSFSPDKVFPALREALNSPGREPPVLFTIIQSKGFQAFAQKVGIWQMGEADLWHFASKLFSQRSKLVESNLEPLFENADAISHVMKKDPLFREFFFRLTAKPTFDLGLLKQVQTFSTNHSWVDPFFRGLYHLPPNTPLEICLSSFMLSSALSSRWNELEKTYLLPSFLLELKSGRIASSTRLKFARQILDNPEILIPKDQRYQYWEQLTLDFPPPLDLEPDTREFLEFLKKRLTNRGGSNVIQTIFATTGKTIGVLFLLYLGIVFLESFGRPRHGSRYGNREKSCYANMRNILGAIEMYNMDNSAMMSFPDLPRLSTSRYLKEVPTCPETGGQYGSTGDMTKEGRVTCAIHQTVE